jgi:hypothetical protein
MGMGNMEGMGGRSMNNMNMGGISMRAMSPNGMVMTRAMSPNGMTTAMSPRRMGLAGIGKGGSGTMGCYGLNKGW